MKHHKKNEATEQKKKETELDATDAATVAGELVGAVVGSAAGPPGVVAGMIIGGLAGDLAGHAMKKTAEKESERDRELDETIGVTAGNLGAARPGSPSPRIAAPSPASCGVASHGSTPAEGMIQDIDDDA